MPKVKVTFDHYVPQDLITSGRVAYFECDFFKDDYPKVDAIMYGNVIHDWPDETKLMLLKKAYDALNPGGYLIVYDFFADN